MTNHTDQSPVWRDNVMAAGKNELLRWLAVYKDTACACS